MIKKNWLLITGIVLVLGVVGLTGCETGGATTAEIGTINVTNQQEGIWVSGHGDVSAIPDIANVSLGIEVERETVAEAQAEANTAMDAVMAALESNGVAEKDIQTRNFSIYKVTEWDRITEKSVVTGYRVTNIVTAKIRDVDNAGTIIDDVVTAGGDLTRIDNISFSIDDPTEYYDEARAEAMANAKASAEQLASLAGVSLGEVSYVSESSYYSPVYSQTRVTMDAVAEAGGTSISAGETEVTVTVQVAYSIK